MLALYRKGRQAEALETYQRVRIHLAEQLGLEPGPALKALQTQILEQTDALEHPIAARWESDDASGAGSLPAPRTLRPTNLPGQPTPLIGRRHGSPNSAR